MTPSLYNETRKHCLKLAEPFRSMPPCMFADQGGFTGLIANLKQSIPFRPEQAQQAVQDFVAQLEQIMSENAHLITDDKSLERRIGVPKEEAARASKLNEDGMSYRDLAELFAMPQSSMRSLVNHYRSAQRAL